MNKTVVFLLVTAIMSASYAAEVRVWQDAKGREYEAEFVRELFDKVTLRLQNGKEVRLAVEELSEHDQKYLRVMVPPEMTVEISTSSEPRSKQYDDQYDMDNDITSYLTVTADISKQSKRPFTSRLTAELFLIGREVQDRNYYILLSKTDSSFLLGDHNGNHHVFKTDPVTLQVYTEYDRQRRGPEYAGYVLAISDVNGDTVQVITDIEWLQDKVTPLRDLYERGKASRYSRYFDKETVTKQPVPRPKDQGTTRMN